MENNFPPIFFWRNSPAKKRGEERRRGEIFLFGAVGIGTVFFIFPALLFILGLAFTPTSVFYQFTPETKPVLVTQDKPLDKLSLFLDSDATTVVSPTIPLPISEFVYVRITADILNVRSGPGTNFSLVYRPRFGKLLLEKGAVCKVKNQEIMDRDGRIWYEIEPTGDRHHIRYPGRVTSKWFIAQEYTEEVELRGAVNVFAGTGPGDKHIEIDLSEQTLRAYEQDKLILETLVSTGKAGYSTPYGNYRIVEKLITQYMQGSEFDLPCVPFVMYFTWAGHALHGAYWHNNFGREQSHGCINIPPGKKTDEWLYWWSGELKEIEIIIRR